MSRSGGNLKQIAVNLSRLSRIEWNLSRLSSFERKH